MADMTASEPEELLPCPFCGGEAKLDHLVDDDDYGVACANCEIQQIANYSAHDAVARWNRRAPTARLIAAAPDLLSIAKRWAALDGGSWNVARYARERTDLLHDTRAAIAKAKVVP